MDSNSVQQVYHSVHFKINVTLLTYSGLWPYRPRNEKLFYRIVIFVVLFLILFPNVNAVRIWCGVDFGLCGENIVGCLYSITIILKYFVNILNESKLMKVHEQVTKNWLTITDEKEKEILTNYARYGKLITLGYVAYMTAAGFAFSQATILPVILDYIYPLNQSRKKILIVRAEYFFDPFEYYYELYAAYCFATVISVSVFISIDTMYTTIVQQSLGVLSVIKFVDLIESSYNHSFLLIVGCSVLALSLGGVILVEYTDELLELIRMSMMAVGVLMHVFFLSYPGQKVLEHTSELFVKIYTNEWYLISPRAKTLLRIMMHRCRKPSVLTAGKLYIMNYENYGQIIKSIGSYITVLASFKESF